MTAFDRPSIQQQYRQECPLFDIYRSVIEERNHTDQPITEPFNAHGAVTNYDAARVALQQLGRPIDDLSVNMALAYCERLEDEARQQDEREPTLDDTVINHFYPFAGNIPTPSDWGNEVDDEKTATAAEIIPQLTDAMLRDLVITAMPAILARIIDRDKQRRGQRGSKGEPVDVPDQVRAQVEEALMDAAVAIELVLTLLDSNGYSTKITAEPCGIPEEYDLDELTGPLLELASYFDVNGELYPKSPSTTEPRKS